MSRRTERESVFKLLFRHEFNSPEEMPEQVRLFFEDEDAAKLKEEEKAEVEAKYNKLVETLPEIDAVISEVSEGWSIPRMGKVDLSIIRLAVYEIKFDDTIPDLVAVNEAVEIAKRYGGDSSPSFVNGILAKVVPKSEN